MTRGTTYRIYVDARGGCVSLEAYRPRVSSFAIAKPVLSGPPCGGYLAFTPGIDEGRTYGRMVRAVGTKPVTVSYRLETAPTRREDDGAPGVELRERGINDWQRVGTRDRPHTTCIASPFLAERVDRDSSCSRNRTVGLDLLMLTEAGDQLACACSGRGRSGAAREPRSPVNYYMIIRTRGNFGRRLPTAGSDRRRDNDEHFGRRREVR